MTLRLNGSTSGFTQIDAAAVAGDNSITLPTISGAFTIKDSSGNTEVGTGVTFNNPSANVFAISNSGGERLRIAADGNITLGKGGSSLYFQNGFNNSSSRIQNGGASGSSTLRFYTNDSGTEGERIRIAADGTTSFYKFADFIRGAGVDFGYLGIGPGGTDEKAIFVNRGGEIDLEFYSNYSGSAALSINSDGTIAMAGEIKIEGSSTPSGRSSRISKYGSLLVATTSDAVGDARCSIDSGNGDVTSIGAASFVNGAITLQSSGKIETVGNTSAVHVGLSLDATKTPFNIYDTSNGNATIARIDGAGAAKFAGGVVDIASSGLVTLGSASNSTNNNGLYLGGNNGQFNLYTTRYNNDCFQILNTSGSGTNRALRVYGNGDVEIAGIIQTNTQSAGNIELDSTGSFSSPKIKLHSGGGSAEFGGNVLPFIDAGFTGHSDLGSSSKRFEDAYVRDGVTTGSDRNYKSDIRELLDAERAVAVSCKSLLRAWKWKDAVSAKSDAARTHIGIVAQDLEQAFTDQGLDAHNYAMFCEDTWYEVDGKQEDTEGNKYTVDSEGAVAVTRLSVRYHELLAFIIAAL